jgi:hypothetical protein
MTNTSVTGAASVIDYRTEGASGEFPMANMLPITIPP